MKTVNKDFWKALDDLIMESKIVIDRPQRSAHPKYSDLIYPVDYGYLDNPSSMDGEGIDIWVGSEAEKKLDAIICTIDSLKRDSEIKFLFGCNEEEKDKIYTLHNEKYMKGIMIKRT